MTIEIKDGSSEHFECNNLYEAAIFLWKRSGDKLTDPVEAPKLTSLSNKFEQTMEELRQETKTPSTPWLSS